MEWKNNIFFEIKDGKGYIKEFYYDNNIKYEGEYLNGERNGKGKEYYPKNKLEFEGEYLNNKRLNGKRYNKKGKVIFEIKNGKKIFIDWGR